MLLLALSLALADPPPPRITGFDRLHADPAALELGPASTPWPQTDRGDLVLVNPHTARARVTVDGHPIGELLPRATGLVRDLPVGDYAIAWHLPGGVVRLGTLSVPAPEEPDAN